MNLLAQTHSTLRYLVLVAAALAVLYLLLQTVRGRRFDRPSRILVSAFGGLLDLQIVLGLLTLTTFATYPALWTHLGLMVLASVVVHVVSIVNKRRDEADRSNVVALVGVVLAVVSMIGGIVSLGRPVL